MSRIVRAPVVGIALVALAFPAQGASWILQDGLYDVAFRLELKHLERWGIDQKATACVSDASTLPPIFSGNNPFAGCLAKNVDRGEGKLTFDIVCSGRNAAKAHATYVLSPEGFRARIEMTMGAKNMTMTEVQVGQRVGACRFAKTSHE